MADRVRHDADGVRTYDGTVTRQGRTGRYSIRFPPESDIPPEGVIRIVLDGSEYRSRPVRAFRGDDVEIRGAFDSARQARESTTSNVHLTPWIEANGLDAGRTVHLDVIVEDFKYGLRAPGESAWYDPSKPDTSLRDIAEDL